MTDGSVSGAAPADEPAGDEVDQAQRLQALGEERAIEAALGVQPPEDHREIDPEYLATLTRDSADEEGAATDS